MPTWEKLVLIVLGIVVLACIIGIYLIIAPEKKSGITYEEVKDILSKAVGTQALSWNQELALLHISDILYHLLDWNKPATSLGVRYRVELNCISKKVTEFQLPKSITMTAAELVFEELRVRGVKDYFLLELAEFIRRLEKF